MFQKSMSDIDRSVVCTKPSSCPQAVLPDSVHKSPIVVVGRHPSIPGSIHTPVEHWNTILERRLDPNTLMAAKHRQVNATSTSINRIADFDIPVIMTTAPFASSSEVGSLPRPVLALIFESYVLNPNLAGDEPSFKIDETALSCVHYLTPHLPINSNPSS